MLNCVLKTKTFYYTTKDAVGTLTFVKNALVQLWFVPHMEKLLLDFKHFQIQGLEFLEKRRFT